jgi:hypothetical protein
MRARKAKAMTSPRVLCSICQFNPADSRDDGPNWPYYFGRIMIVDGLNIDPPALQELYETIAKLVRRKWTPRLGEENVVYAFDAYPPETIDDETEEGIECEITYRLPATALKDVLHHALNLLRARHEGIEYAIVFDSIKVVTDDEAYRVFSRGRGTRDLFEEAFYAAQQATVPPKPQSSSARATR